MNFTFDSASTLFLNYEKNILKFQTFNLLERNFRLHIIPYFKEKKISDIKNNDLLFWYNEINQQKFCAQFKNELRTALVQLYDYLILYYDVSDNLPKKLSKFKNCTKKREVVHVWTIKDCRKFLKVSKNDIEYNCLFDFMLSNGVRIGEALALTFNDLEQKKIKISQSLSKDYVDGKQILQSTKTNRERYLYLDFKTKRKIKRLQKYYTKKYNNFNKNFYLFGGKETLKRTTIARKKDFYCKIANVPRIRIHDFRHTHASILYSATKNIKIVQERLGHANSNTTINTYIHIFDKEKKRTTRILNLLRLIF